MANQTPWFNDSSQALCRRLLVLQLHKTFKDDPDSQLESKLIAELPGILNWAIAGLKDLRASGGFTQPASGARAIREIREVSSRIELFIQEACEVDPRLKAAGAVDESYRESIQDMFTAWCHWCRKNGERNEGNTRGFSRELRSHEPAIDNSKHTRQDGKNVKAFTGIRLNALYRAIAAKLTDPIYEDSNWVQPDIAPPAPPK
jgi:putative DNA primase/helicase